jgi:hypothetical protein
MPYSPRSPDLAPKCLGVLELQAPATYKTIAKSRLLSTSTSPPHPATLPTNSPPKTAVLPPQSKVTTEKNLAPESKPTTKLTQGTSFRLSSPLSKPLPPKEEKPTTPLQSVSTPPQPQPQPPSSSQRRKHIKAKRTIRPQPQSQNLYQPQSQPRRQIKKYWTAYLALQVSWEREQKARGEDGGMFWLLDGEYLAGWCLLMDVCDDDDDDDDDDDEL